ncbi:hypothetical protein EJD97_005031 [Solanum chilense]|uniref:CCHC-type domain-containing protein n=1 Tax=Solanum chilense TaxID=4083 RepID=A0A6N2BTC1_SOLCI|nr:hypothetical protein EJD97_005031 [Solanum chilense]
MNTRRNTGEEVGGEAAALNQEPPQAPGAGREMSVDPTGLTDGEVKTLFVQMAQAITLQAKTMTNQAEQQDTPRERPPYIKCGKVHGGEYRRGYISCYSSGKPSHIMKDCPYMRGRGKGKEKVQTNVPSEEVPRRQRFFALMSRGVGEDTSGDVSGA